MEPIDAEPSREAGAAPYVALSARAALWGGRLVRFAMGGGITAVGAVFAVIRNKWLAEHLSTAGIGVLGQVLAAQSWLGTVNGLGLSLPIARAVGAATAAADHDAVRRTVWTALVLVGTVTLVVTATGAVLAPFVSQVLLGTAAYATLVRVAMAAVAALSLQVVVMGLLSGRSDTRALLLMAVVGGVFGVVTTFALVPRAGIVGGAIGVAVMVPAGLIAAAWTRHGAYREVFVPLPRPAFDPATAGALLRVGMAALLLGLLELGTPLALRLHYLRVHGISANGLLQAALALAQQVSAALIAYLFYYAFGRVSAASGVDGVRDYTRRHWKALVAVAAASFGAVMYLAGPLLVLFYSREFAPARPLMAWILFAEFCRVMAQVWSLGALPMGALRTWVAIGVAGPAAYVLAYVLFTPVAGLLALPYAAVVGGLVQLATAGILMSRRGVTVRPSDATLLALSLVGLAALARTVAGAP